MRTANIASIVVVCLLPACSGSSFSPSNVDASADGDDGAAGDATAGDVDAGDELAADAGDAGDVGPDGCALEDAVTACNAIVDSMCLRRTSCCVPICPPHPLELGTGCYCLGGGCNASDAGCTGACFDSCTDPPADAGGGCHDLAKVDPVHPTDCSKYAGKHVCRSLTSACTAALPSMACSDWTLADSWNWPAECGPFWAAIGNQ